MDIDTIKKDFCFVECWWEGKRDRWERIQLEDVEKKVRIPSKNIGCCTSVQRYRSAIASENEQHISDFIIDIDCKGDLPRAFEDTKKIFKYLHSMKMGADFPQVYYSGMKGFHIRIPWEIFKIRPTRDLNKKFKLAAEHIANVTRVKTIDAKIYSNRRQIRLPNSIHPKTGLYKHEIPAEVIMDISLDDILEMAKEKSTYRPQFQPRESEMAMVWWKEIAQRYDEEVENLRLAPVRPIKQIQGETPVCIQYLIDNGISKGLRNKATMNLVSFYKDQGLTRVETKTQMTAWCKSNFASNASELRERLANSYSVIKTVYENKDKYNFACSYMNGCREGDDRVPCETQKVCRFINDPDDQIPQNIPEIKLARASAGQYIGVKVRVPIHVVAKEDAPYAIPAVTRFTCDIPMDERQPFCEGCPVNQSADQTIEHPPTFEHRQTLNLIQQQDYRVKAALREVVGIPDKCKGVRIGNSQVKQNIVMIHMNPMLKDGMSDDEYSEATMESSTYTHRQGYFMGHDVEPNRDYYATMRTYSHPKDQKIAHLIEKLDPAASSIDTFEPSPELLDHLKVFQVAKNQTVEQKMDIIHHDLEINVHKIKKRPDIAKIMDLFYHSTLRFRLGDVMVEKGWFELLVVGDSGEGKSAMAKRLRWHFQLGDWVSGESSGRTGLVYAMQKNEQKQWYVHWGKIPQNDRGAITIDEMSGIDKKEWGKFTELRSTGIAECNKSVQQKTVARTRMMCITNPIKNKDLSEYRFGIEAVADLYANPADVRRVDVCCGLRGGEVDSKVLNSLDFGSTPHVYTSDLCKNLILWTWSRKVNQIYFDEIAIEKIYENSRKLADKYGGTKVLVVSASDQKFKLARISVAVAARLFSTDKGFENLIIKREHVMYASKLLQRLYDADGLKYNAYAREYREKRFADDALVELVKTLFEQVTRRDPIDGLVVYFSTSSLYTKFGIEGLYDFTRAAMARLVRGFLVNK